MPDSEKFFIGEDDVFKRAGELLSPLHDHIILEIPEMRFSEITFEEAINLALKMKAFEIKAQEMGYNNIIKLEDDNRNLIIYELIRK